MRDLRAAVRAVSAAPIVSIVIVLSLALGIGANTAIFSVLNSLLLRPLPVAEPQRLVAISSASPRHAGYPAPWTYATWDEIRQRAAVFDGAFAWGGAGRLDVTHRAETQPADAMYVSGEFFSTLGVTPLAGRTLTSADDVLGGRPDGLAAVVSYRFWQRRFGGAADVIGVPILVERVPFTIVGVAPPEFFGVEVGRTFDIALPLGAEPLVRGRETRIHDALVTRWLRLMLRLKRGQSLEEAAAALRTMQPEIRDAAMPEQFPRSRQDFLKEPFTLVPAVTGMSGLRQRYQRPLGVLFIVVALVLLIACANIANLLLARATARRRELSVRLALGASHWRVARELLAESLVLAAVGALLGLLFAAWGSRVLVAQVPGSVILDLSLDWRVMTFTAAVAVLTALLFGTAPALRATRVAPIEILKEPVTGGRSFGAGGGVVIVQVALSVMLVFAAGLFLGTFTRLARTPLGFDGDRVLVVDVDSTRASVDPAARVPLYQRLVAAAAAAPGVAHAAGSIATPVAGPFFDVLVDVPGMRGMPDEERTSKINFITPGWFAAYGTAIRTGRDIAASDTRNAPRVALVNHAFARKFFPAGDALGGTFTAAAGGGDLPMGSKTIVGIAADMVAGSIRGGMPPMIYVPLAQWDFPVPVFPRISISVRAHDASAGLPASGVTASLAAVERNLTFSAARLGERVNQSIAQERLLAALSAIFGALALLLASIGLYGVTTYTVSRRTSEIGIRLALGAAPAAVVRLMCSRVLRLVAAGLLLGTVASLWVSRFAAPLLHGIEPHDPLTLSAAAATIGTLGAFAAWLPARRASHLDPATVLRQQ